MRSNLLRLLILLSVISGVGSCTPGNDDDFVTPETTYPLLEELELPAAMIEPPVVSATLMLDGRVLITQYRYNHQQPRHNIAHIFNPVTKEFIEVESMYKYRQLSAAELLPDGRVMVIGGYYQGDDGHTTSEIFDPLTNTWSYAPECPRELHNPYSTISDNGLIFTNEAIFDVNRNSWIHFNMARDLSTITKMADGNILYAGGKSGSELSSPRYFIINPQTLDTVKSGNMNQKYMRHTTVLLDDGRIMIGGGNRELQIDANPFVEFYDPATAQWSTDTVRVFESSGDLIKQPNGKVLAYDRVFHTIHIFDPETNRWTDTDGIFPRGESTPTGIEIDRGKMLIFIRMKQATGNVNSRLHAYLYSPV